MRSTVVLSSLASFWHDIPLLETVVPLVRTYLRSEKISGKNVPSISVSSYRSLLLFNNSSLLNKIRLVYSAQYANLRNVFFSPHAMGVISNSSCYRLQMLETAKGTTHNITCSAIYKKYRGGKHYVTL